MFELLTPTPATLTSVTNRVEKHGDDDVPAISLGLKIETANTVLDTLSETLRRALYTRPDGQEDLPGVEQTTPLLRTRDIETLSIARTLEGWTLTVEHGIDEETAIELGACKVDKFKVAPKEGGSVELSFRVGSSDVMPEEAGQLWAKNGQEVSITLTAPKIAPAAKDAPTDGKPTLDPEGAWPFPKTGGAGDAPPQSTTVENVKPPKGGKHAQTPEEALAATQTGAAAH